MDLLEKIENGDFKLSIVGIGRVGLPLGLTFAKSGVSVVGLDVNEDLVKKVNSKKSPFKEAGLQEALDSVDNFHATTDENEVNETDIIILTVGTPLTEHMKPDYSQLRKALSFIGDMSLKNKMIIMRSTASPGTMEKVIKPFLENETGLKSGKDFGLAVCPERIVQGYALEEIKDLPEIIGALDEESFKIASKLFKKINPDKTIIKTNPNSAELAKLFSNVYRYVNFALANEFGMLCEIYGEDANEVIKTANKDYKRNKIPVPGLAGGPCLSKDGYYLTKDLYFPDFISTAWKVNESIPQYIINNVKKTIGAETLHGKKIGVLGKAFKSDIDDDRYSPAQRLIDLLENENAEVTIHDPYFEETSSLKEALNNDVVILAMNHSDFKGIEDEINDVCGDDCLVVDCWNVLDEDSLKANFLRFGKG